MPSFRTGSDFEFRFLLPTSFTDDSVLSCFFSDVGVLVFVLKLSSHVTNGSSDKRDAGSVNVRVLLFRGGEKRNCNKNKLLGLVGHVRWAEPSRCCF